MTSCRGAEVELKSATGRDGGASAEGADDAKGGIRGNSHVSGGGTLVSVDEEFSGIDRRGSGIGVSPGQGDGATAGLDE